MLGWLVVTGRRRWNGEFDTFTQSGTLQARADVSHATASLVLRMRVGVSYLVGRRIVQIAASLASIVSVWLRGHHAITVNDFGNAAE